MRTVSFYGQVEARSTVVLCSPRISTGYVVRRMRVSFANGCFNLVKVEVFVSPDDSTPTTGKPSGLSVLDDYGQVPYVVGNAEVVDMFHDQGVDQAGSFLKVYANNTGYQKQDVSVQVEIEPTERR